MPAAGTRYRFVADALEKAIRSGTYAPGQRLPSVRALCRTWSASISTVVAAYALLERRGLVDARPQSGHYARVPPRPQPEAPRPRSVATDVGVGEVALGVMRDSLDPRLAPFGPALPDPALLPTRRLARVFADARRSAELLSRYDVPPGSPVLRAAIARRAAGFGCAVRDELVVTAGALEACALALRATCRAGQTVAIESPLYYGLLQSIEALGLRVVEVLSSPSEGMSVDALREALDEHPIAAVVAMPCGGNPTGSLMPEAAKRELVELLAARRIPLIEDDALGELVHDGSRPPPAKAFDRDGGVLWCSSLSKTAAPGLRIGWIAAGRWRAAIEHLLFTQTVSVPPLAQEAAAELLDSGFERTVRRARAAYAKRARAMAEAVSAAFPAGTRVGSPRCGFSLWVELPDASDGMRLHAAALREGVSTIPGALFSAKLRYRRFIRLNASRWDDALLPALRRLGRVAARK